MLTPEITTVGANSGLIKITDHEGVIHRVPVLSVCHIMNSSNADVDRFEICTAKGDIVLIYSSSEEVTTAIAALDALY